jgi:hypothetical protein
MLAFLQGSAAHITSSLLEQRSAGALLKLACLHTVLQNALPSGACIYYVPPFPPFPHRRFPRGGQKLVIDPEMGKGQILDGELCVYSFA